MSEPQGQDGIEAGAIVLAEEKSAVLLRLVDWWPTPWNPRLRLPGRFARILCLVWGPRERNLSRRVVHEYVRYLQGWELAASSINVQLAAAGNGIISHVEAAELAAVKDVRRSGIRVGEVAGQGRSQEVVGGAPPD